MLCPLWMDIELKARDKFHTQLHKEISFLPLNRLTWITYNA